MAKFAISTDSNADLYAEEIEKLGIYVGHLNFTIEKGKLLNLLMISSLMANM